MLKRVINYIYVMIKNFFNAQNVYTASCTYYTDIEIFMPLFLNRNILYYIFCDNKQKKARNLY